MKKADLIICNDGSSVIMNIDGCRSIYYPHPSEEVIKVMVRPANDDDIKNSLEKLGISNFDKIHSNLKEIILNNLNKIRDSYIAYGLERYDDRYYTQWFYEVI